MENTMTKAATSEPLLEITGLHAGFKGPSGYAEAVRGVGLSVKRGEVLGIVGESGSGKSVTMMAMLQLLPDGSRITGSAKFAGEELVGMPPDRIRKIRGKRIGVIFQDPLTSFNPVLTIGHQIGEAMRLHDRTMSERQALAKAEHLLDQVAIPQPSRRVRQYPHEFSGGMRQRAMIAMAIANNPDLLIADEPTTALDVTVQAQILDLLGRLRDELNIALVLITHDLGVVASMANGIAVMYGGRVVERGTVEDLFYRTRHPYTRGLMAAMPRLDQSGEDLVAIQGTPPSIWARPSGCSFHVRCPVARPICSREDPLLLSAAATEAACHFARDDAPDRTLAEAV
jgi:oligopeptide/dipeptide ABC transporter ATP-binding protein